MPRHGPFSLVELSQLDTRYRELFLDLERKASEAYSRFVFDDEMQADRFRRFLFDHGLAEFSSPYGRFVAEGGRVLGMMACLTQQALRAIRLRAALALSKAGLFREHPALQRRVQMAGRTLMAVKPGDYYLSRIAIVAEERERGVGSFLMAHFEAEGITLGCRRLVLEVSAADQKAAGFYERQHFTRIDSCRTEDPATGRTLEYLHMAKVIA